MRASTAIAALGIALATAGCGGNGTFVLLEISGAGLPAVARVTLSASFAGRAQTTELTDSSGTVALPTTASIEVRGSGSGDLSASAEAFDGQGASLAKTTNSVTIRPGKTVTLALALGGSALADMAPPRTPPVAPTAVGACGANGQVRVSYQVPDGATGINIYYQDKPGVTKATGTKVVASSAPPFVVSGLTNGTDYSFVVTAVNAAGESPESAEVTARPDPVVHDTLFSPSANDAVEIWDCVSQLGANAPPTRTLTNAAIHEANIASVAVDGPRAILYVSTQGGLLIFDNATTVDGGTGPSRVLEGSFGFGLSVDSDRKRLYVYRAGGSIQFYTDSDTVNGAAASVAHVDDVVCCPELSIDGPNDRLFVAGGDELWALGGAGTRSGAVAKSAAVFWSVAAEGSSPEWAAVTVEATTLYVANSGSPRIHQLRNIDGQAMGQVTPAATILLPTGFWAGGMSVAGNALYLVAANDPMNRIFIYDNVSTLNGMIPPTRTLTSVRGNANHALYIP